MLNMLVIGDSLFFLKTLINSVVPSNPNLRLCMIATDGREALDVLKKYKIDIILLDLEFPIYTELEMLDFLSKNMETNYNNSIIVISRQCDNLLKIKDSPFTYCYISKGTSIDYIVKKIDQLIKLKSKDLIRTTQKKIKKMATDELIKIGYNVKYKGTDYLSDTICLLYFSKNMKNLKLEKDIYPILAKKYGKSVNTIKCDIISATKQVEINTNENDVKKYFSFFFDKAITPKLVINTILNKIKYQIKIKKS